ncbi:MAG: FAD-dependent oxidoreductase [Bacillota bacterium]
MAERGCMVKYTEEIINSFLKEEACCSLCRRLFNNILKQLEAVREGEASQEPDIIETIGLLAGDIINSCRCDRGRPVAEQVISILQDNLGDFAAHIEKRICPAAECPQLVIAPCQAACPAGIDVPNYVALVGEGRYEEALELIREDAPLPGVLGRVCEHPCTKHCVRGRVDSPIAICALKRLAYDKAKAAGSKPPTPPERKYDEKIAVVGSGPAGLSAAYFLAKRGYGVTIFEAMAEPGGMLAYGIPPYRLPREVLRDEIAYIKAMGVEFKLNTPISGSYDLDALKKEGYAAIFLSSGAWEGFKPKIPNLDKFKGVYDGVSFLRTVNKELLGETGEEKVNVEGKKVVVVGGGNVAIDAARVSLRLGAREVRIIYRRTREEMPALREEIEDAEKEGVVIDYLVSPVNVGGEEGRVKYIECVRNTLSEPDESGRRRLVPVKDSDYKIDTDVVIFATGQQPILTYIKGKLFVTLVDIVQKRIMIKNPLTMETSQPGVFSGGDSVTGPATVIMAIAAGKRAAAGIDAYLRGKILLVDVNKEKRRSKTLIPVTGMEKAQPSLIDFHALYLPDRKNTFAEITKTISEEAAGVEARRCLRCDICISCGRCVENCRVHLKVNAIRLGYINSEDGAESDFKRPEETCIGCGTCYVNCPTGAITLEDKDKFREMRMCGTLMSRLELVECQVCGQTFATVKHIDFINANIKGRFGQEHRKIVCPDCTPKVLSARTYRIKPRV